MPKPEDDKPDSITFGQFTGIKNTVARERLTITDLERAINVDLDNAGQLKRRRGYRKMLSGNCHSMFTSNHGSVYVVKDGNLCLLNPDFTTRTIVSGVGIQPLAYVHVNDTIYFSSSVTSGKFNHDTLVPSPWGAVAAEKMWLSPVVNPTPTLPPIKGKSLMRPPLATALAYYNGRIYMAVGKAVWVTELYLYDWVDDVKGFTPYEADVTVLASVTDGLYVGTETGVWFQTGPFNEMKRVAAVSSGALPGSAVQVPPHLIPDPFVMSTKSAIMLMTQDGVCLGMDGGNMTNVSQDRVVLPKAAKANALFRSQDGVNQYIGVADSGGSPVSSARIGDYVDAEIRRFQGA